MANLTEADAQDFGNGPIHVLGDPNSTPEADNIDTSAGNLDYSIESFGGDDVIVTGDGDADLTNGHTVQGGDGSDTITGGAANDNLRGGTFNSTDADGDDTINGGGGDDSIVGGQGNDTLNGDAGNDGIDGEAGNDIINGGTGNDLVWGGAGDDTIDGGDDYDIVFFRHSINAIDSVTYNAGTITVVGPEGTDTAVNVEQISFSDNPIFFDAGSLLTQSFGTAGDDTLDGDDENNYIIAGAGNDTINGGLGIDSIVAGKGNDIVDAGEGNDTVLSGEGDNTIDGGAGDDLVGYNFSRDQIISIKRDASGVITLQHAKGTDTLINVEAFDFFPTDIDGNRTSNTAENVGINDFATVFTGLDDETINGTTGDDVIDGGIGDDTINGLAGNDTITGGDGDDVIDGGDDTDTAVFDFATSAITSIQRNVNGVITLASASGTDTLSNIESLQFTDQTLQVADLANTFANIDNETITGTSGNDVVDGGAGTDTFVLAYPAAVITSLSLANGTLSVSGPAGTDALTSIEALQFTGQTFNVSEVVIGSSGAETLTGTANGELIFTAGGADVVNAGAGNDTILAVAPGATVNAGSGTDTVAFNFTSSAITSAVKQLDNSVIVKTAQGNISLNGVEQVAFSNSTSAVDISSIVTQTVPQTPPKFNGADANGNPIELTPTVYTGPVDFLQFELIGQNTGDVVTGSAFNDFMNLAGGDDAANGGDGQDVLDGGTGSNFLTGGNGADTFFLDGRGGSVTWSTITDFNADNVNIWGWVEGTSKLLLTQESAGADGFKGATFHYDLNNDGNIDTSITFSGLTTNQVPGSTAQEIAGNGYLLFA